VTVIATMTEKSTGLQIRFLHYVPNTKKNFWQFSHSEKVPFRPKVFFNSKKNCVVF